MNTNYAVKYLKEIEKTIATKINLVKEPSELLESKQHYYDEVLKIYQEAFTRLIEYSVTFSKLLNEINNAYRNALHARDERISLFITQDKVFGVSQKKRERDDQMKKLINENEELKKSNLILTSDKTKLKKEIDKRSATTETISTDDASFRGEKLPWCPDTPGGGFRGVTVVVLGLVVTGFGLFKLKDDKFSDYLMLLRERDARYTLYHENLALELKCKELVNSSQCHQYSEEQGDPVILRIALDRCREQLSATQSKLKKMIDDYSDTVPRREYDVLENKHHELNKKLDTLKTEYEALENCYRRVVAQKKSLQEELSEIKERCRELERAGTPRPQWEICADFIAGGRDRWWQLARGLSSRDILMVLLKELGPAAETEHLEYFDGLGTDPAIPPYLRYEGKVRNLRLSRRELSIVINDIWNSKLENGRHVPMQDYVTQYFEERYAAAGVRAEWAYNVCAGARRALDEPQLRLFCGTLLAALSEDVYWAHREAYHALKADLYRHARDGETITLEEFEKVAKSTFPLKSEVDIKNLSDVVRKQLKMKINHNVVNLDNLFLENEEGFDRLDIARELFRQRQLAQDKYIREIVAELGGRRASNKCISVDNLKRAFAIVDPAIDHIRMQRNIRWAFSDQTSELNSISPIPLRTLVARLAAGNIERVGPRYKGMHRRTFYK